jgi:hypothetical protein
MLANSEVIAACTEASGGRPHSKIEIGLARRTSNNARKSKVSKSLPCLLLLPAVNTRLLQVVDKQRKQGSEAMRLDPKGRDQPYESVGLYLYVTNPRPAPVWPASTECPPCRRRRCTAILVAPRLEGWMRAYSLTRSACLRVGPNLADPCCRTGVGRSQSPCVRVWGSVEVTPSAGDRPHSRLSLSNVWQHWIIPQAIDECTNDKVAP